MSAALDAGGRDLAPRFPFSAVVAADELKLGLVLGALDPALGGVLLRGDKGTAKTTLARGLAALLPGDAPFAELPLGASEERLIGSLDLASALAGERRFEPGVLAAAHGGVLYVDEVNLLADHLVDVLLDVAVSGRNVVEREGISHVHPARFVLIGSMNPEEGELRPQLLDRFGLAVEVTTPTDPATRALAVRRRVDFDADPAAFAAAWAREEAALGARLATTTPATLPDALLEAISALCAELGAQGLRADLAVARAAAALAGWESRPVAGPGDVARVAPLALAHRRRRGPFDAPGLDADELAEALQAAGLHGAGGSGADGNGEGSLPGTGGTGSRGADHGNEPSPQPVGPLGPGPAGSGEQTGGSEPGSTAGRGTPGGGGEGSATTGERSGAADVTELHAAAGAILGGTGAGSRVGPGGRTARGAGRLGERQTGSGAAGERGRVVRAEPAPAGTSGRDLAVRATATAAARRRAGRPEAPLFEPGDARVAVRDGRAGTLVVVALDTSGSMGARDRLAAVTGAVLGLLADAYRRRDEVALVTFRDRGATTVLRPTGSVEVARARLADVPVGGATPLAAGILEALAVATAPAVGAAGRRPVLVVCSDGRATAGGPGDPLTAALDAAAKVAGSGVEAVVLDCELGPARLGLAGRVAEVMGARHVPLDALLAAQDGRVAASLDASAAPVLEQVLRGL